MKVDDLSAEETYAVKRILAYWMQHWDFECPTLFGMELDEVQLAANAWPQANQPDVTALAVLGAMREFLYGASAVPREQIYAETGLTFEAASALLDRLFPRIEVALGRSRNAV
jgi:hypothetical protein